MHCIRQLSNHNASSQSGRGLTAGNARRQVAWLGLGLPSAITALPVLLAIAWLTGGGQQDDAMLDLACSTLFWTSNSIGPIAINMHTYTYLVTSGGNIRGTLNPDGALRAHNGVRRDGGYYVLPVRALARPTVT